MRDSPTYLNVLLGGKTPLLNVAREAADRVVSLAHALNLVTGTVGRAGVGHTAGSSLGGNYDVESGDHARVTAVTVGDELQQDGAVAVDDPVLSVLDGLHDGEDIHTIGLERYSDMNSTGHTDRTYLDTRDQVTTSVVLGVRRATLCRGTHTILVVLADEHAGQVPELRLHIKPR